jgi:hypothetical protein
MLHFMQICSKYLISAFYFPECHRESLSLTLFTIYCPFPPFHLSSAENRAFSALLPDGRISGQITQKRPQKIVHGRKKLEAVKWQNFAKSGRKEAGKYFYYYLAEKPFN